MGEDKQFAGEIVIQNRFLKWLDNFWYHYKWTVIVVAFFLFVGIVCLVQCSGRESADLTVTYAGGFVFNEEERAALSNALESAGTVTSALIPWNTCGVFILGTLNIGVMQYAPYAVFNWLMPLVTVVMAYMGLTVANSAGVRLCKAKKAQKTAE